MSEYVGLKRGKVRESNIYSEYYCGGCGWPVTDHDSYCPECGGELHEGMDKSRWHELFGTPEKAARTLREMSVLHCEGCVVYAPCKTDYKRPCLLNDYDALLEWLEGGA